MSPIADNVIVSNSAASSNPDYTVWTDELVDPVSGGTVQKQIVGLVDATAGGTTRAAVGANGLAVSATIVGTVPTSGGLTDTQLRATPVPVSGTVAVTGTFWQATQPVSIAGNQAVNTAQIAGTTTAVNTGNANAGTQRVVLATDQPAVPVSGTISVSGTMPIDATHLEDAIAGSGDTGIPAFAVRRDTPSAGGADGDYVNLSTDSTGALRVTGGGGGTQYVEDTASTGGETMTLAGVVRQDTLANSTTTDGDYAAVKVNNVGSVYTKDSDLATTLARTFVVTDGSSKDHQGVLAEFTTAGVPTAVTSVLGLPVAPLLPVQAGTATLANVSGATSSTTLIASNSARKGLVIVNDSTAICYVKFGSTASSTSFTYMLGGSVSGIPYTLELPATTYTGIVTGIWASATGSARVTELT